MTKQHLQQQLAHNRMEQMGKTCPPDAACPHCPTPPGVEEESPPRSEAAKNYLVQLQAAANTPLQDRVTDFVRPMGVEITDTQRFEHCLEHGVFLRKSGRGWLMQSTDTGRTISNAWFETARGAVDDLILNGRN